MVCLKKRKKDFKPMNYKELRSIEKINLQKKMKNKEKVLWINKPEHIKYFQEVKLIEKYEGLEVGKIYFVEEHICELVISPLMCYWVEFLIITDNNKNFRISKDKFNLVY